MSWGSIIYAVFYALTLPFTRSIVWLCNVFLFVVAPLVHLGRYVLAAVLLPLRLMAKLEALYIFLGVAALIGLFMGSVLHLSSALFVTIFHLRPGIDTESRSAASAQINGEQRRLQEAWQKSTRKEAQSNWQVDAPTASRYAKWLPTDITRTREDPGLLGQVILEEEDDSEDGF